MPDTVRFDLTRCPPRAPDYTRIFDESEVTTPPEMVSSIPVRCPDVLRQMSARGTVIFRAVIDTTGAAEPAGVRSVVASREIFTDPSREMLVHSQFEPGRLDGRKVRVRARVPVDIDCAGQD